MRILLIVSSYAPNPGGLQTVTRQLARELQNRGNTVAVIANRYPRKLAAVDNVDQVPVMRWQFLAPELRFLLSGRLDLFLAGFFYMPSTLARLLRHLRRERPDVVNLHFVGAPAFFVRLARSFIKFRLVVSVHGDDVEGLSSQPAFDRWLFRSLLRKADRITACSRYLLDQAARIEPCVRQKGRVIHNGINQLDEPETDRNTHGLFAAGRMVAKKGFDVLLRAFAGHSGESMLTLVGDGPERKKLETFARTLGLNGEVRFRGNRDQDGVLAEMADAQIVAIPSLQEPFGLIALEAMSMGKPIVASRVGGLPEVLEGADAVLVNPGDAHELGAAIEMVRERLRSNASFGKRNRDLARRFSLQRMVDNYLLAYQE